MKYVYLTIIASILVSACSTEPLKLGTEYGWYCNSNNQKDLDKSKFTPISYVKENSRIKALQVFSKNRVTYTINVKHHSFFIWTVS